MTYPLIPSGAVSKDVQLDGYSETGHSVPFNATPQIDLDGRPWSMVLTGNIVSMTTNAPTPPACSNVKFSLIQDATGGRTVAYDAAWQWADDTPVAMPSGPNQVLSIMLDSTMDGRIEARGQVVGP